MTLHPFYGTTREPVFADNFDLSPEHLASNVAKQAASKPPATFDEAMAAATSASAENPKDRYGIAKPSMHFVPMIARLHEAVVMALGAKKYGPYNWRKKKVLASVYADAIERHLAQWMDGSELDEESGVSHLAHVRACAAILIDAQATGNMVDDRPKTGGAISAFIKNFTKEGFA